MKKQSGFTLVELMIVLVIIGIMASFAVPSYKNYIMRSIRSEGMTAMLDLMRAQEDFFANNYRYTTTLSQLNYSIAVVTSSGGYSITARKCKDSDGADEDITDCVELIGDATGGQAEDGDLILNSRGERKRDGDTGWNN